MTAQGIHDELDRARRTGPVRDIIIPPCPELLQQLRQATAGPEVDLQVVNQIANADVAMAAAVIRQANSPLFALQTPVQTVGQAMTVLGLQASVQLLTGFLTRRALPTTSPALVHFWDNSTRKALACEHIGHQLYQMDPGLAYSFGLFCHVGMPVLFQAIRGYASTVSEALARQDRTFTATENANHRTDHAVVGAIVAKTWRLPADAAIAIRLHHDFSSLDNTGYDPNVRRLVAMGLIADHLIERYDDATASREWLRHGSQCRQHLQIGEAEVEHWVDELHPAFESAFTAP